MPWRKNPVPQNHSFYFLAGPGQGGGDWQREACELIYQTDPHSTVAVPHRYDEEHTLNQYFFEDNSIDSYLGQTDWERRYLEIASLHPKGVIIFWLQSESITSPRTDGLPYAIQTYGELGEWRGRMIGLKSPRIVIGASPAFPGLKHIQQNFNLAFKYTFPTGFPIFNSLEETVRQSMATTRS